MRRLSPSTACFTAKMQSERQVYTTNIIHSRNPVSLTFFSQAKTIEVDRLRFSEKDLNRIGTLERGSFGEVCH